MRANEHAAVDLLTRAENTCIGSGHVARNGRALSFEGRTIATATRIAVYLYVPNQGATAEIMTAPIDLAWHRGQVRDGELILLGHSDRGQMTWTIPMSRTEMPVEICPAGAPVARSIPAILNTTSSGAQHA